MLRKVVVDLIHVDSYGDGGNRFDLYMDGFIWNFQRYGIRQRVDVHGRGEFVHRLRCALCCSGD